MLAREPSPERFVAGPFGGVVPYVVMAAIFLSSYLTWRPSMDIMFTLSDALFLIGFARLTYLRLVPLEPFGTLTTFWLAGFTMLVGGLLIGSVGCPTPSRWLLVAGQYLVAWVILPMILLRRGPAQTARMLKAFAWGVFAMNLLGAIVYFTYTGTFEDARKLFGLDFLSGGRRLGAFASDANWNGAVLAMAAPVAIFLRAKRLIGNIQTLIWLGVILLGVMLCASFTAFISCVAAVALFVVVGGIRPSPRASLISGVGAALALLAFFQFGLRLPSIFVARVGNAIDNGDISEAGTYEGRVQLIQEAWRVVENHLLIGIGADQYRVVSAMKAPVHNMYLLLWAEGGLISVIGWILMMTVLVTVAIKAYPRDRIATALTLSVTTTLLIASTASPHMYARLWSVPVLLSLAVSLEVAFAPAPARRRRATPKPAQPAPA